MKRKIFNLLFISFISCCLIIGLFSGVARAEDDEPGRTGQAYEQERTCIGSFCFYTGRQYTSQYDLLRGEIYPEITVQYMMPNWGGDPWSMSSEYEASAIGGLFTPAMMRFPVSGPSYMLGTLGAPQVQSQQYQSPFGSMSYQNIYQGLGLFDPGFRIGPFASFGGYSGAGGYGGGSQWGSGWGGYPGYNPWGGGWGGAYPQGGYPGWGGYPGQPQQYIY